MKGKSEGISAAIYARTVVPLGEGGNWELDMQVNKCLRYAANQEVDVEVVRIIRDVGSGTDSNRPGLSELNALIAGGEVGVVLVCRIDRLSRSLVQCLFLVAGMEIAGVSLQEVEGPRLEKSITAFEKVAQIMNAERARRARTCR